jgi:hypothetical protein
MRAALILSLVLVPACFKPLDAPLAEIPKLGSIEEVMRANETVAGPQWKMESATSYTDEDWAKAKDASARLAALAERSKEFSRGDAFNKWADTMGEQAKALGAAAEAKDAAAAGKAIGGMKGACKGCHAETR